MRSFHALPVSLLAFVFTLPALAEPFSAYDPFHDIATKVRKDQEPPVCCLRPLSPLENTDDDILLSFEEWKARQVAGTPKDPPANTQVPVPPGQPVGTPPAAENASNATVPVISTSSVASLDQAEVPVPDAPYFRIPIIDRFNYASTDCSARVHTAHKSAKSSSSILSSKKDRYMLSPCGEQRQYVVVELCDDIRIDTVQLANYEFFSGVFKDFTVSVAKTYTTDPSTWTFGGTYRAKNIRGVQSFHTPMALSDFYRFIRIDFHSHYGNEFYCPLSLLRVYGLTHLEHWKWDLWESDSRARRAIEAAPLVTSEPVEELQVPSYSWAALLPEAPSAMAPSPPTTTEEPHASSLTTHADPHPPPNTATPADALPAGPDAPSAPAIASLPDPLTEPAHKRDTTVSESSTPSTVHSTDPDPNNNSSNDPLRQHTTDSLYNTDASEARQPNPVTLSHSEAASPNASQQFSHVPSSHSSVVSSSSNLSQSVHVTRSPPSSVVPTFSSQSLTVTAPAPPTSGESIYRTIMNRLTALETNTSLYARFVEEHAAGVREVLRRLSEDVGRLEGIGKAQSQMYQRSVSQFERQQRRLELEHTELLAQVRRLTEEVVLEKRLGVAQLCLLLAVLVFMALTRGSRNEPIPEDKMRSRTSSLRSWGQRTLNLSSDWVRFRTRSMSPTPTPPSEPAPQAARKPAELDLRVEFPSQGVQAGDHLPRSKRPHATTGGRKLGASPRPRTPIRAHFRTHSPHQPPTPATAQHSPSALPRSATAAARPPMHRAHSSVIGMTQSLSMGVIGPVPRSAKHWARSAHLHEVKPVVGLGISKSDAGSARGFYGEKDGGAGGDGDGDGDEGFIDAEPPTPCRILEAAAGPPSATTSSSPTRLTPAAHDFPLGCTGDAETEASEGDAWVDTDADESESDLVKSDS